MRSVKRIGSRYYLCVWTDTDAPRDQNYAEENGIECYISLEERMACGIGACLACVCKTKEKIITVMCITKESVKTVRYFVNGGGNLMNTKVTIAGVEWNNPVTVASGTFGSGAEFTDLSI